MMMMMMRIRAWLIPAALLLGTAAGAAQQPARRYRLEPAATTLWFEARATLGAFRGSTHMVSGWAEVSDTATYAGARGVVEMRVATLRTGIGLRDRHLRADMQADQFPLVVFRLDSTEAASEALAGAPARTLRLRGQLQVKATTRPLDFPAVLEVRGDTLRVSGRFPLRFTDFGMQPPTRIFGTARVRDELVVGFQAAFLPEP